MGIIKQNDGPISWPTGGTSDNAGGPDGLDDPSDQYDRRNVCPFPTDVPHPRDGK